MKTEKLSKEKDKIVADGNKNATNLKRKAEKNIGNAVEFVISSFYKEIGMKN